MRSAAPLLLALDTSTSAASVALYDGQRVLSESTWLAGREHSTRLLVEVEIALERIGRDPADLTGLAVARGPGSFTGVRVALSVAKGLAVGLQIPLWGVSSLEVLAHAAGEPGTPVRAVLEAGRGRFATGLYVAGESIQEARVATLDQLCELIEGPTVLIGELDLDARRRLAADTRVRTTSPAGCSRRAGFLAELGWRLAQAGEPGDAQAIDALYAS